MDIEPGTCTTDNNLWNRFVCWLHGRVEPLCEKSDDGTFKATNKLGIGSWRLLSYGTECGCCHGLRILLLCGVWWFVGISLPVGVGLVALVAVTGIVFYIGHRFAKSKETTP